MSASDLFATPTSKWCKEAADEFPLHRMFKKATLRCDLNINAWHYSTTMANVASIHHSQNGSLWCRMISRSKHRKTDLTMISEVDEHTTVPFHLLIDSFVVNVKWRIRCQTKSRPRAMDGCERFRERICQSDEAEAPIGIGNVSDYSTKTPTATTLMLPTALPSRRRSCSGHPTWLGAVRSAMLKFMDASRVRQDCEEPTSYVAVDSRGGKSRMAATFEGRGRMPFESIR
nr:unnamed protein product [Spirometra erinaceieuropaei]